MRLGIDTGGTYTDAVLYDNDIGVVRTAKTLTTHYDLSVGIRDAINRIDCAEQPLSECITVTAISTTLATNAIVEGRGGSVCLLLIGHKPESLNRAQLNTALRGDPAVFLNGGHTAHGDESQPIDLQQVEAAVAKYANCVSAFAVAGMFSVRNNAHEIAVRNLIMQLSDRPVTCSHELTANLDAPRRATTAVLNARLIAPIAELVQTVSTELEVHEVSAPLMVVKGDGSMISAEVAKVRPVETVLSGPAASIVGASRLSDCDVSIVSDIGGTTTDIAILSGGEPRIDHKGAHIGGFKTFVEAVDVYTVGLGGDSQVSFASPIEIGPNRAMPICSLSHQHHPVVETLKEQLKRNPQEYQGCFLTRRRSTVDVQNLSRIDKKLWDLLEDGPVSCEELLRDGRMLRAFNRLRTLDLVQLCAFTPTDALHVLGMMDRWSVEAATLAAQLWTRGFANGMEANWDSPERFCEEVIEAVIHKSCESLVMAAVRSESTHSSPVKTSDYLLNKAISKSGSQLVDVKLTLNGTLAVVGAPASPFYPEVASRLNLPCDIPEYSNVGNAVGAAAGDVSQRVSGLITSPAEGVYRIHTPSGVQDFSDLEKAADVAIEELESLARVRAVSMNPEKASIDVSRNDNIINGLGGHKVFIESQITVSVSGQVGARR
ncbi:MAG: hydantoinase/oxoprolinase family protein [Acidiferrobacterales bacterium]|nr:hydantoinase/oxoprolinase family protein [Acidiferrobacterales bacterium]